MDGHKGNEGHQIEHDERGNVELALSLELYSADPSEEEEEYQEADQNGYNSLEIFLKGERGWQLIISFENLDRHREALRNFKHDQHLF